MKIAVIIAAYNNWRQLRFSLQGYHVQTRRPDELIVAEDSEFSEVAAVAGEFASRTGTPVLHLTQPDQGFRKCRILNRAIQASRADYLIFTDADVVPRNDVVATFERLARPRQFLSGGSHVNIDKSFHETLLTLSHIESQQLFSLAFLRAHGQQVPASRLMGAGWRARLLDRLTDRNAFVGNLSGAWRDDLLRVSGFDESFGYGAEDRNLGVRLNNAGIRGHRARHSLVCLHLDHDRSYVQPDQVVRHKLLNEELQQTGEILPRQSGLG